MGFLFLTSKTRNIKERIYKMAVPQRKVTHSRKAKRGSHLSLSVPTLVACKRCGKKIMPHRVCNSCGYYKGKKILQIEA